DTDDLDGVFSGLGEYKGDPLNGFLGQYDPTSWQYTEASPDVSSKDTKTPKDSQGNDKPTPGASRYEELVRARKKLTTERDETLLHPRCVFQIVKRHYSRYTPEMVERITGCPRESFLKIAEAITNNSGPERTTAFCYAVGWTQHTVGPQL